MKTILLLLFFTLFVHAADIQWEDPTETKRIVSKLCIDGYVWYYTGAYAPIVPKLIYETRSGNGHNALPQTAIYHAKCKEIK